MFGSGKEGGGQAWKESQSGGFYNPPRLGLELSPPGKNRIGGPTLIHNRLFSWYCWLRPYDLDQKRKDNTQNTIRGCQSYIPGDSKRAGTEARYASAKSEA